METLLYPLADMLRRTLDLRFAIKVDVAPACPPCVVDPAQIEAALLNLAINARDAMPDGGTLSFKAWPVERLPPEASVGAQPADIIGHVAVSVADTGKGMCCAVKQRALEPFFTTKEPGQGTGLGLSSVLGFVTQSHGAMRLESAVGAGTTVTLFLPRYRVAG
jgi:signal transduction histidine kinase